MTEVSAYYLASDLTRPLHRGLTNELIEEEVEHDALTRELVSPLHRDEAAPLCQGDQTPRRSRRR